MRTQRPLATPELAVFVRRMMHGLRARRRNFLADVEPKAEAMLPYRHDVPEHVLRSLARELRESGDEIQRRFTRMALKLEARPTKHINPQRPRRLTA